MKIKIHRFAAALLLSACILQPSALFADGSLTPPGAPAPTMKTLGEIEPRTPISSAPYTITAPGSYYLTTNLTVGEDLGIFINVLSNVPSGVTLDLNGFTISSTATNPDTRGNGIHIYYARNVTILNGFIEGRVGKDQQGIYGGSGFFNGIYAASSKNVRVSGVSVIGCLHDGMSLGGGTSALVESCTVQTVGGNGIIARTIKASRATDCGSNAIYGQQVADCSGESSGGGIGLSAQTAQNCDGSSNFGTGLIASTAQNCIGSCNTGQGLVAGAAQNCGGTSISSTGLQAFRMANTCWGTSTSFTGLRAPIANSCSGSSDIGTGLDASIANSCSGTSNSSTGLYASNIANSCYGSSSSGTGLSAYHSQFSAGRSPGGVPLSVGSASGTVSLSGAAGFNAGYLYTNFVDP